MPALMDVISNDELTRDKIAEIFRNAYMNPVVGDGADVRLTIDGIKVIITVDQPRKILHVMSLFGAKPGTTRQQLLELCNRINDGLVLIRAAYPSALPTPTLMLDDYVVTEAGLTALEIVDEARRFRTVISSVPPLDQEHILV